MLPDERASVEALWPTIKEDALESQRLHDALIGAVFRPKLVIRNSAGLNPTVVHTVLALFTKACKTFRAIEVAGTAGLGEDAATLARSLYETALAILFILQRNPKQRTAMLHAYAAEQSLKMLNRWKQTPGLKRRATKALFRATTETRDGWARQFPGAVDVRRHWSGSSLEQAAARLRTDVSYQLVYRYISRHPHGADVSSHIRFNTVGEPIFTLSPGDAHVREALTLARVMLWIAGSRINERLGLGIGSTLDSAKPKELSRKRAKV